MRILMVSPLVSGSSFVTTYIFAKILQKEHEVKIIGPTFGQKPFAIDKSLDVEFIEPLIKYPIQLGMVSLFSKNLRRIMKNDYDVVHTFKLLPHTAPVASFAKRFTKKPFVVSIDDYDVASPKNPLKRLILKMSEGSYKEASAVTVSSSFLQKIYGGVVIYQTADEKVYDPKKVSGKKIRKKYGLEDKIVIVHVGTLHEHKGVDVLIKTVQELGREDVKLILFEKGENVEKYKKMSGEETVWIPQIPFQEVADYTAAADIYAIPTKDSIYSRAEIPTKIFEAMALGKAIVASNISDIPLFLNNGECGMLTEPGSVESLKEALTKLIDDPTLRKSVGQKARERYLKEYSSEIIGKKILDLFARFEK